MFFQDLIRGNTKIEKLKGLKYLSQKHEVLQGEFRSSLKSDEKLFWWLLSDANDKIVIYILYY